MRRTGRLPTGAAPALVLAAALLVAGCSNSSTHTVTSGTPNAASVSTVAPSATAASHATAAPAGSPAALSAEATVPSLGNLHVNPGQGHAPYNTDPPTSGAHFPQVPQRGIYTQPFATEYLPHFLEHGGVNVNYNSSASPAVVQKLTQIVSADLPHSSGTDIGQVTLSPRPDMPCMVAVTAWQRIETWGAAGGCTQQVGDTGHDFDPNSTADTSALISFIAQNQCQYDPENQCGHGAQGQTTYPTIVAGQPTVIAALGKATAAAGQGVPQPSPTGTGTGSGGR